jgi:hypothetical protein
VGDVVQTILVEGSIGIGEGRNRSPDVAADPVRRHRRIVMPRFVRHFLFASLIACHAAVMLCGPCLHELPGSSHQMGLATKTHRTDAPAQSSRDSADNCLICHFMAQGQLTVDATCERSAPLVTEIEVPELPTSRPLPHHVPSSPRAPPTASAPSA